MSSPYPRLHDRALGWLRFVWRKATTEDDWSVAGEPHAWWDRTTGAPMTSFPRFDLVDSSYAIALMADKTPAWREIYAEILNSLVDRHRTFWAAVDWLTQIGHDPQRASYPASWKGLLIPEHLWGNYDAPGWTANGVAPWGLQPDPIAADGMLFFKGFFNLLMSLHRYVSNDDRWDRPFPVTGLEDRRFSWSHGRIADLITAQWRRRPEGPHCENTKIWPYCLSAAGLGLQMYDNLARTQNHAVAAEWFAFARAHYILWQDGQIQSVALYYDPVVDHVHHIGHAGAIPTAWYMLPQDPELSTLMYRAATNAMGWRNPGVDVLTDRRSLEFGLRLAREFGDTLVEARLLSAVDRVCEPRRFGADDSEFGFFFHLKEPYPRGQMSANMMIPFVASAGDWQALFQRPNLDKFQQPTLVGVDFPRLGIRQAWNDPEHGVLHVETHAATLADKGIPTSFRITNLASPELVKVLCDGQIIDNWRTTAPGTITVDSDIGAHKFQVVTGMPGQLASGSEREREPGKTSACATASGVARISSRVSTIPVTRGSLAVATACPCCVCV